MPTGNAVNLINTSAFPSIVNVEVFRGACPCACRHCPVGRTPEAERARRFGIHGMALDLYERIAREIATHPDATLRLHSVGEPVLWPELGEALAIGRRVGVRTWLFTSALTHDRHLLQTIGTHVDVVEVSVNSTNRQDYRQTKGVDAFDLVTANLRYLSEARHGGGTRLIVSRTQTADKEADQAFVRYWQATGLVDDAFVRSYHTYNDLLPQLNRAGPAPRHEPCLVHWARFNISVAGQVVVCFNELFRERLDPRLILGNVRHETIAAIWHGPQLAAVRSAELSGDYDAQPFLAVLPCRTCTSCQPVGGNRPTSECQLRKVPPCRKR